MCGSSSRAGRRCEIQFALIGVATGKGPSNHGAATKPKLGPRGFLVRQVYLFRQSNTGNAVAVQSYLRKDISMSPTQLCLMVLLTLGLIGGQVQAQSSGSGTGSGMAGSGTGSPGMKSGSHPSGMNSGGSGRPTGDTGLPESGSSSGTGSSSMGSGQNSSGMSGSTFSVSGQWAARSVARRPCV